MCCYVWQASDKLKVFKNNICLRVYIKFEYVRLLVNRSIAQGNVILFSFHT